MGFQSKTYSLSDEVVAAIEAARKDRGLTPNQLLRRILVDLKETPLEKWKVEDVRLTLFLMRKSDPERYRDVVEIVKSLDSTDRTTRGPRQKGDRTR